MRHHSAAYRDRHGFASRRSHRHGLPFTLAKSGLVLSGVCVGLLMLDARPAVGPGSTNPPVVQRAAALPPTPPNPLLEPVYAGGSAPLSFAQTAPLASEFTLTERPATVIAAMGEASDRPQPEAEPAVVPDAVESPLVESVPVPMPRPSDLREPRPHSPFRAASRQLAQRNQPAIAPDNRSFLEKFFGMGQSSGSGPALAYAAPEDGFFNTARGLTGNPARSHGDATAIYDISSHTVYMPNGARLEAHSGLGDRLDDPRFVHERMRGPTPPHTYTLTEREQLFHGVRALRLNPVGEGSLYGRNGLLAHTFMLGPKGDSNGCVSFKDYNAFLQAFLNGDVKRLVVVARLS